MQLEDVVQLVAEHGAERRVKRAGVVLPLTVGALMPGAARLAVERASSAERALQHSADRQNVMGKMGALSPQMALPMAALGNQLVGRASQPGQSAGLLGSLSQLGGSPVGGVASGISGGIGERIKRMLMGREFGERQDPGHIVGSAALKSFGSEAGKAGIALLQDIANKAVDAAGHAGDDAARQAILGNLKRTDPVLSQADDATLMESYNTMKRFAPVLSTDKNAVRSFLRQAVMSGSGPDFMTIDLLGRAERSVTGEKKQ